MKYALTLLLCLACNGLSATYYVDADSTTGGDGTTAALSGANRAYPSLNAALVARYNSKTLTEPLIIICGSASPTHTADTTAVLFNTGVTTADNYVEVRTDANNRAGVTYNTNKYRLEVANSHAIDTWSIGYVRIDGLQIKRTGANSGSKAAIKIEGVNAGNDVRVSNCHIVCSRSTTYQEFGISVSDADTNIKVWNCIIYGFGGLGNTVGSDGISTSGHTTFSVYSCTIIGDYIGILNHSTTTDITVKNCYAYATAGASQFAYYSPDGTTNIMTTCASSDNTSSTVALRSIAYDTTVGAGHTGFNNVTAGSEDFTLKTGSVLINAGTDTSGDASPLNFTTDITGATRSGSWDVGAYEAPTTALLPLFDPVPFIIRKRGR